MMLMIVRWGMIIMIITKINIIATVITITMITITLVTITEPLTARRGPAAGAARTVSLIFKL